MILQMLLESISYQAQLKWSRMMGVGAQKHLDGHRDLQQKQSIFIDFGKVGKALKKNQKINRLLN